MRIRRRRIDSAPSSTATVSSTSTTASAPSGIGQPAMTWHAWHGPTRTLSRVPARLSPTTSSVMPLASAALAGIAVARSAILRGRPPNPAPL
jgi:hypothetical protein